MRLLQKLTIATAGVAILTNVEISSAKAASFTFNPEIIFEAVDGGSEGLFDGNGDRVFLGATNTAKGPFGEASTLAEFNITGFSLPQKETITSAIFQVNSTGNRVVGGSIGSTNGRAPTSLDVQGYIGNGQADASDFQAGILIDTINVLQGFGPETFNFDATSFVESLLSSGNSFAGFNVRASDIGAIGFSGSGAKLIITTSSTVTSVPESYSGMGVLTFGVLAFMTRRRSKNHATRV